MKEPFTSEISELKKKLEDNPEPSDFVSLADAYRRAGSLDEARKVCDQGLAKNPDHWNTHFILGRIYQEQSKSKDAVLQFKKVLEIDPENHMAHSFLADLYMKLEDFKSAIDEYQAVMTINPDDDEAQSMLKTAIEKAANASKVSINLVEKNTENKGMTQKPDAGIASLTMAELYMKQSHFDKALEVYEEILGKDPDNEVARQRVVELKSNIAVNSLGATQPSPKVDPTKAVPAREDAKKTFNDRKREAKFTDEDIFQVVNHGGKSGGTEEKKIAPEPVKTEVKPTPMASLAPQVEKKEPVSSSFSRAQVEALKGTLAELAAITGIRRCSLISLEAITVVSVGENGNNEALEKQVLSIFKDTNQSAAKLDQGFLRQVLVTAETGHILLFAFAGGVLVVLADHQINLGMLRLAMDNAAKKIEKIQ